MIPGDLVIVSTGGRGSWAAVRKLSTGYGLYNEEFLERYRFLLCGELGIVLHNDQRTRRVFVLTSRGIGWSVTDAWETMP